MAHIEHTVTIARRLEDVWAYFTQPENYVEWQRDCVRVEADGPFAVGTVVTEARRFAGIGDEAIGQWVVKRLEPLKSFEAEVLDPFPATMTWHFESEGDSTRLSVVAQPLGGGEFESALEMFTAYYRQRMQEDLERAKALLDAMEAG